MTVVLLFGERRVPRSLTALPVVQVNAPEDVDAALDDAGRLVVLGAPSDLAVVLTRLLRCERLDVEVAHVTGPWTARRARTAAARRVPLIRDETGTVIVGRASWLPPADAAAIEGEGIVDDTVLFDGRAAALDIEPLPDQPGLRARVRGGRWVSGRAAQLGTTGATVLRDGVPAPRTVKRSTFYRHIEGWLCVGRPRRRRWLSR